MHIKAANNHSGVSFLVTTRCFTGDVLCNEARLALEDDILGVLAPDYGGCSHSSGLLLCGTHFVNTHPPPFKGLLFNSLAP